MDFINSKKLQDDDGIFKKMRDKIFKQNLLAMIAIYGLGYLIIAAFYTFPLIEFAMGTSIRFPQPLYVPFDFASHSWIWYAVAYAYLCFSTHNSGVLAITHCLFLNTIMEHVSNEFRILGSSYENVLEADSENATEDFKKLVKYHQELLE